MEESGSAAVAVGARVKFFARRGSRVQERIPLRFDGFHPGGHGGARVRTSGVARPGWGRRRGSGATSGKTARWVTPAQRLEPLSDGGRTHADGQQADIRFLSPHHSERQQRDGQLTFKPRLCCLGVSDRFRLAPRTRPDPKAASTGPIWLPRSSRSGQATVQTIWQRLRCCCGCSMCRRSHRNLCGAPWTWSHCWVVDLLGRDSHAVDGLSRSPGKLNTRWHGPARERERDHRRRPAAAPRDRHPTACRRMPRHVHNPPRGSGGSLTSPPSKMLT